MQSNVRQKVALRARTVDTGHYGAPVVDACAGIPPLMRSRCIGNERGSILLYIQLQIILFIDLKLRRQRKEI